MISALGYYPFRVVLEANEDPKGNQNLLGARYASSQTVSTIAVQIQLFRMEHTYEDM